METTYLPTCLQMVIKFNVKGQEQE